MPSVIRVPDLRSGYIDVVRTVATEGDRTAPRGEPTRELLDVIIELEDPTDSLPVGVGRKLNRRLAYAEAIQLLSGVSDPRMLVRIAPNMDRFREPDGTLHGAYGRRIGAQLVEQVRKLEADPDSRRAVVTLWDARLDNLEGRREYPCTVMLQFLIRDGKLIMHTTMRSADVWWGLGYDGFQFTQVQLAVARALNLPLGSYHHHAVSLHAYERDLDAIERLHDPVDPRTDVVPLGIGHRGMGIGEIIDRGVAIVRGNIDRLDPGPSESEMMYAEGLHE